MLYCLKRTLGVPYVCSVTVTVGVADHSPGITLLCNGKFYHFVEL